MSMVFKKLKNKILVHMKTFDKPQIRVLDHLIGREKHLSVFFSEQSLFVPVQLYFINIFRPGNYAILSFIFTYKDQVSTSSFNLNLDLSTYKI